MEKVSVNGQMEKNMMVNILMAKNMVQELINIKMVAIIKVIGKMVNNMEKDNFIAIITNY